MLHQKINMTMFHQIWETTMLHQKNFEATMLHQKVNTTVFHQNVTNGPNSGGTWSFISQVSMVTSHGVWSLLKFLWSMVVSQILVEPGHINFPPEFEKWQCPTRIWEMTMFHQILRPFWWNTVIFIFRWSMVAFQIFWWNMVTSQIFVEHGRFSNFGWTLSFLLFLVEHGPFSNLLAPVISLPLHSDWYALVNIQPGGGMQ